MNWEDILCMIFQGPTAKFFEVIDQTQNLLRSSRESNY